MSEPTEFQMQTGTIPPTQIQHPWRATLRTAAAGVIPLLLLLPVIVEVLGVGAVPWVASVVGFAAAVTRVLAIPAVADWIEHYLPWLAPAPRE